MTYELIISEKPAVCKRIAEALADGKPIKKSLNTVPYYEITRGKRDIVVACAVGHLYGLGQKDDDKKWIFPIYDVEWKPVSAISKKSDYQQKYIAALKKLAVDADEFTVATDYDIEGEVIGLNVIRFACAKKDANRMKFSTLTKDDLIDAYEHKSKHLDWGQANAGETRHKLDWFYGINISRALTAAIKTAGAFKVMSTGRVQGPALKLIVDKEKEIKAFKPVPFWEIEMLANKDKDFIALHELGQISDKPKADKIMKAVEGQKTAVVKDVDIKKFNQSPPIPFDLTSLQIEAHGKLGISPKETLQLAQELYISGFISYPRTSSQILPEAIGFKKIISSLARQSYYSKECSLLLSKSFLKPNNGSKTDPAHPAIYPTGIEPRAAGERGHRLYDLIVRRFLATFGDPAVRQTMTIKLDCNTEMFIAKGTLTLEKGWHVLYGRYARFKEEELPSLKKNDCVKVKKISLLAKETQPPKRYTESSIIKELEKRNLGTKATRAQIIDTLFQRGYVDGKQLQATEFGIQTTDVLEKYCPDIVDEELTRHFEVEMEDIRVDKAKPEDILDEAKDALDKIVDDFKTKKENIGKELLKAQRETQQQLSTLGMCPECRTGSLQIRKGKFGNFIACSEYPKCRATYSLPQGMIKPAEKECEHCKFPMVKIINAGKRSNIVCFNKKCSSRNSSKEEKIEIKKVEGKKCPKCSGTLVLRSSVYGKFFGCSSYPKCRYTERITNGEQKKEAAENKVEKKAAAQKIEKSEQKDNLQKTEKHAQNSEKKENAEQKTKAAPKEKRVRKSRKR